MTYVGKFSHDLATWENLSANAELRVKELLRIWESLFIYATIIEPKVGFERSKFACFSHELRWSSVSAGRRRKVKPEDVNGPSKAWK
jgi:hypothetical protein